MPQAPDVIPGKWSSDRPTRSPLGLLAAGEVMNPGLHLFNGLRRGSAVEFPLAYNEGLRADSLVLADMVIHFSSDSNCHIARVFPPKNDITG